MYNRECNFCKKEFETKYLVDKWCSATCKIDQKTAQRKENWAKVKPRVKPKSSQAIYILDPRYK